MMCTTMVDTLNKLSRSTLAAVLVLIALISVLGTTALGWEWGASFTQQPIPMVLIICSGVIAIIFAKKL